MNKNIIAAAIVIMMSPLGAYAGAADSVGNGISNIVGGVGDAVKDVGQGVGDGVTAIGNGVGNAFTNGMPKDKPSQTIAVSDSSITKDANANIENLADNNKIKPGYDLKVATVNGVVVISGTVMDATDINTIQNSVNIIPGVKDVNTQNITVK